MNKRLRKFLEQNGLRTDASDNEAWAMYYRLRADGVDFTGYDVRTAPGDTGPASGAGDPAGGVAESADDNPPATGGAGEGTRAPASGAAAPGPGDTAGVAGGERVYRADEVDDLVALRTIQGISAEITRRNTIGELLDVAGLRDVDNGRFARTLIDDSSITAERASNMILTELQQRNIPIGAGAQVGREAGEKFADAAVDGLLLRSGVRLDQPVDGARELRGRSLLDIARDALDNAGIATRGLSRNELASRALTSASTSDFGHIFASYTNRRLLAAYEAWPSTWRPLVVVGDAVDFKDIHAIKLSGSPDLLGLGENGEYKTAKFSDSGETYRVITKGRVVRLTRNMIVNDDLRAFARIPMLFGAAAKRMESAAVYSLITDNGKMSDGKALYHEDRGNLAAQPGPVNPDTLSEGRVAMLTQKGMAGEDLDVYPSFLLHPVRMQTEVEIILRSTAMPDANLSAGVYNPFGGKFTPIAEPALDRASEKAWYLFADPSQMPVIEVAYLEGEEQPYVDQELDFDSDSLKIKVRHDFGAGKVDGIGTYKNPGE